MLRNLYCPVDEAVLSHDSLHKIAFGAARDKIFHVIRKAVIDAV
jgi:hypothetical protein